MKDTGEYKLIEGWKESWKFWSTQLAVLIAVLQVVGTYLLEAQVWTSLGTFLLALLIPVLRIITQRLSSDAEQLPE